MDREYEVYTEITKEVLDSVKVGDLVLFEDWKTPLRVKGVSENYFVAARNMFGKIGYSICEKKPWPGVRHNAMLGGRFHIGPDHWILGWYGGYNFDDEENMKKYLESLESGETALSERRSIPVSRIAIKRA